MRKRIAISLPKSALLNRIHWLAKDYSLWLSHVNDELFRELERNWDKLKAEAINSAVLVVYDTVSEKGKAADILYLEIKKKNRPNHIVSFTRLSSKKNFSVLVSIGTIKSLKESLEKRNIKFEEWEIRA